MTTFERLKELLTTHQLDLLQLTEGDEELSQWLVELFEQLLSWHLTPSAQLQDGQAVVAFSFGQGPHRQPGGTNRALAAIIQNICQQYDVEIYAQWEIAELLQEDGCDVAYTAVSENTYLSTRDVWSQIQAEWARAKTKHNTIILVAHPDHQYRCHTLLSLAGYDVLVPDLSIFLPQGWEAFCCDSHGYDPNSTQPWTRSRQDFLPYELRVRLKHVLGAPLH